MDRLCAAGRGHSLENSLGDVGILGWADCPETVERFAFAAPAVNIPQGRLTIRGISYCADLFIDQEFICIAELTGQRRPVHLSEGTWPTF